MKTLGAALALALSVSACADLGVGPSSPHPNVMVPAAKVPTSLVIAPGIRDEFLIPRTRSVGDVPVTGWRATLATAFRNAFPGAGSGRRLELVEADLEFSPAAVSVQFGTTAVFATIRFKARLLDEKGEEVGAIAGTAHARQANTAPSPEAMTDNAQKAVEAMYEKIAGDLLSR